MFVHGPAPTRRAVRFLACLGSAPILSDRALWADQVLLVKILSATGRCRHGCAVGRDATKPDMVPGRIHIRAWITSEAAAKRAAISAGTRLATSWACGAPTRCGMIRAARPTAIHSGVRPMKIAASPAALATAVAIHHS